MDLAELGIVYISEGADAAISKMAEFGGVVSKSTTSLDDNVKAAEKVVSATQSLSDQITRSIVSYKGAQSAQYEFAAIAMGVNDQLFKQIEMLKTLEEMEHEASIAFRQTADAARKEQGALIDLAKDIEHLNKVRAKEAQEAEAARAKELASREAYYSKIVADAKAAEQAITDAKHKAIVDQMNERDRLVAMYAKDEQERVKVADKANKELAALNKKATDDALKESEQKALSEISWAKKSRDEQLRIKSEIATHRAAGISDKTIAANFGSASLNGAVKEVDSLAEKFDKVRLNTSRVRSEMVVIAHEAVQGRFSRIPASLMVFAEYSDLSSLALSGFGISLMAAAAAAAVLSIALYKGLMEQRDLQNALIMTGNYAGTTEGALNDMAHSAVAAGGSIGVAKGIILELASSGKFTAEQIRVTTDAIVAMEYATGGGDEMVKKLTADFKSLQVEINAHSRYSDELTKAVIKLDTQYHFLTTSTLAQIRALEDEGRTKEASKIATDEFAKVTHQRAEEIVANLGNIELGWRHVKEAIGEAWSAMKDWGKTDTSQSRLQDELKKLAQLKKEVDWHEPGLAKSRAGYAYNEQEQIVINARKEVFLQQERALEQGERSRKQSLANVAYGRLETDAIQAKADKLGQFAIKIKQVRANLAMVMDSPSNSEFSKEKAQANADALIAKYEADAAKAAKGTAPKLSTYAQLSQDIDKISQKSQDMLENSGKQTEAQRFESAELIKQTNARNLGQISISEYLALNARLTESVRELTVAENANSAQKETDKAIDKRNKETEKAVEHNNKLIDAYEAAKEAADIYIETAQRAANIKIGGLGQGNRKRAEDSAENAPLDKFDKERKRLEKSRAADGEFHYKRNLELAKEVYQEELAVYESTRTAMNNARESWAVGASEAYNNYKDEISNVAKHTENAFSQAFKGMEDAMVNFVKTGKLDFASLADSIVSDLIRIQIQKSIMPGLSAGMDSGASWVASLFAANGHAFDSSGVQAYANGGAFHNSILTGTTPFAFASGGGFAPAIAGEAGPEAVMPLARGANGKLGVQSVGAGGGNTMVVNIIESPGQGGSQTRRSENGVDVMDVFVEKIKSSIAGDISRGSGSVPSAMSSTYGLNRVAGAY